MFLASLSLLFMQGQPTPTFVRTVTDDKGVFTMQTAAHRLHADGKPDVWLVGAAHIGEKSYYASLQQLLDSSDEVLYEGVRKDDKAGQAFKPAKPSDDAKPAQTAPKPIYQVLSDALGLDFQLNDIHYDRPNWINTDLSMEDLEKLNKEKGGGKPTGFDGIAKMLDPTSPAAKQLASFLQVATPGTLEALKLLIVQKLSTIDPASGIFDPTTQAVILKARNDEVGRGFAKALGGGQPPKSIAIFYGALHQKELEQALISKYGYVDVEQRWFTVASADKNKIDDEGRQFLKMAEAASAQKPPAKQ